MKRTLKQKQGGFTLIEIVMVIAILGILAAVAIPRFVDLSADARNSAIQGAAGALSSYSAINYANFAARGTAGAGVIRASNNTAAAALIGSMAAWDAVRFSVSAEASCSGSALGTPVSATLIYATAQGGTSANSAVATIICTG